MKAGLMLAGAAAGLGSGLASIAQKYIDADMEQQKAEALAALRVRTERTIREEDDAFRNDPARIARDRANRSADTIEAGKAADAVLLNRAGNQQLTDAMVAQETAKIRGTSDANAEAAGKKARAEDDAKSYDLAPGQRRYRGGEKVAENDRPTTQEVQASLYERGLKQSGARGNGVDRMSEAGKVQLQGIEKRDAALQQLIDKGLAEGSLSEKPTGPDGKPSPGYDQYQAVLRQRQTLHISRQRLLASEGVIDGGDDADKLIRMGASPAELEMSVAQAKQIGGEYAQSFVAAVEPTLQKARSTDYKQDAIRQAAERNGDKNYRTDINGQKGEVRAPRADGMAQAAAAGAAPDTSIAGRARARDAYLEQQRTQETQRREQAAQAFAALQPGDRRGAAKLQASDLFQLLTSEQQRQVYYTVNGR